MDVKYQVFVSSTFKDLEDERRKVMEAILNLRHIPVGMELFQATDDTQWDYIKRRILECDYYVVIVGDRYGSEQDGKSYTQLEYEFAVANGIPVAAFLISEKARDSLPKEKVEFAKSKKINAFRELCQKKLVKFWDNADDLAGKVALAMFELTKEKPRTGWVKADAVPSEQVLAQMSLLVADNHELRKRLSELSSDNSRLILPAESVWRINKLASLYLADVYRTDSGLQSDYAMLIVFLEMSKSLALGIENWRAGEILQSDFDVPEDDYNKTEAVLAEFASIGLIDFVHVPQEKGWPKKIYQLTPYGKEFLVHAYAYMET